MAHLRLLLPLFLASTACYEAAELGGVEQVASPRGRRDGGATPAAPTADAAADGSAEVGTAAPPPAASTSDAGADASPKPCTALLCEDFESGAIDTGKWTIEKGYATANDVTVQSTTVARGKYAARAHLENANGGFAWLRNEKLFPGLKGELWARAYLYVTVDDTVGHHAFVRIADSLEVGQSQGKLQLTFYPAPGQEIPRGYASGIPRNVWTCVEWHVKPTSPQIELYVNGTMTEKFEHTGTETVPDFDSIRIGLETHGANTSVDDVFVDDVAIDANRVGCL